ncbi:MAG: hypothetical protein RLZZ106_197 [Cyanobacteriota bacterium]
MSRSLGPLPKHFHQEELVLQKHGVASWQQLAALSDGQLRQLSSQGGALERQLRKLRGQAQLVVELQLEPHEAALLLYAGIASSRGLAQASPQQLLTQLGRLERSLTGMAPARVDASTVRLWIQRAQQASGRSGK